MNLHTDRLYFVKSKLILFCTTLLRTVINLHHIHIFFIYLTNKQKIWILFNKLHNYGLPLGVA